MFEFKFISTITEKCGTHLQLSSEDLTNILNLVPEFKSELWTLQNWLLTETARQQSVRTLIVNYVSLFANYAGQGKRLKLSTTLNRAQYII